MREFHKAQFLYFRHKVFQFVPETENELQFLRDFIADRRKRVSLFVQLSLPSLRTTLGLFHADWIRTP